ncbi:MFS transporter [Butyrivibrio fibrisolvens]|uniref:Major Facilitator Superfamily protein n=1 Tax=Butyrivibrio fibrisolvens TaxID=831 RepID=A0A317FYL8_BUTFI|nr:MFS transporter [Butyrivibrio fibrisolvens]PWT26825.1 hypothetical protein CPT75_06755 [Butyrivibrio fibrisolvens]
MKQKTRELLIKYKELKHIKEIMKVNLVFFLFFMLSDSMDVFMPLFFKNHSIPAMFYGGLQTITTVFKLIVIWLLSKPQMKAKRIILTSFIGLNMLNFMAIFFDYQHITIFVFAMFIITRTVLNIIMNPYLGRLLPNEYMGIGFGIRDVFLSAGCALGLLICGYLQNNLMLFGIYIIVVFVMILFLILTMNFMNVEDLDEEGEEEDEPLMGWINISPRMKVNFIIMLVIGCLISCGLEVHTYSAMIGDDLGIKAQNIYNLYASSVIITAVFSIIGGVIIDIVNSKLMYFLYTFICFISVLVLCFKTPYAYAASLLMLGIKGVLDNVEQTYLFKGYKAYDMEKLYSVNSVISTVLNVITPLIFGYLYDYSFDVMLASGLGCLFVAMIFSLGIVDINRSLVEV